MFAGKKSAQIREILISESAWEEMTCLFAPSLAVTPYITGADKCFFSNLLNRRRHAGKHAGTGVMPVLINKNGMTNQSGRDNNPLLNGRYQQEDEREYRQHQGQGRVPQYQRWHFAHCQRTGITTRFMLLPPRIPRFVATSTALLHFCTSGCCAPV